MKWFKFPHESASAIIKAAPPESVGKAVQGIFLRLDEADPEFIRAVVGDEVFANLLFDILLPFADQSAESYRQSVENGRIGANNRWNKDL